MTRFNTFIEHVLKHEGGLSTNPKDPGNWTGGRPNKGELQGTRYGISAAAYPNHDIVNLSIEQAKALYYRDYWRTIDGDILPAGLDYAVFDAAINAGVRRSIRWLQKCLRITADGILGPQTHKKLAECDPSLALRDFQAQRLYHYMRLVHLTKTYGYGWARRTLDVYAHSLQYLPAPSTEALS